MTIPGREARALATVGATVGLALVGAAGAASAAAPAAPYTDANVVGSIGLCDQAGHQVTSGSIDTKPFAWRAVSTQPAPAPYDNDARTATLYAYQPQQGLTADEWSGAALTSSSSYTNPADPMAAATAGDKSLADLMGEFRPKWDGFLQLRMYLGTRNEPAYTLHYPALDIQVTGSTWHAVGGSPVDCSSGTAESLETIVLPTTATGSTASGSAVRGPAVRPGSVPASVSRSTSPALIAGIAAALVVLATAAAVVVRRRRPAADVPDPSRSSEPGTISGSLPKGHRP